ncbi:MAG: SUF system NifU family Fe-S cluster assembly protein [Candidatus Moraniibacteriota bacterium]
MSIYQDQILDHYRNPRHYGSLEAPTHRAAAKNPTCGDALCMDLRIRHGTISDVRFTGSGCAISQASASLLSEYVHGKSVEEALTIEPAAVLELLGVALSPGRLKCGLLSLETLKKSLTDNT